MGSAYMVKTMTRAFGSSVSMRLSSSQPAKPAEVEIEEDLIGALLAIKGERIVTGCSLEQNCAFEPRKQAPHPLAHNRVVIDEKDFLRAQVAGTSGRVYEKLPEPRLEKVHDITFYYLRIARDFFPAVSNAQTIFCSTAMRTISADVRALSLVRMAVQALATVL